LISGFYQDIVIDVSNRTLQELRCIKSGIVIQFAKSSVTPPINMSIINHDGDNIFRT